jgi:hypothetical protein
VVWTGLVWLRIGSLEGSCEHSTGLSGSIKCWDVTEYLQNCSSIQGPQSVEVSQLVVQRLATGLMTERSEFKSR